VAYGLSFVFPRCVKVSLGSWVTFPNAFDLHQPGAWPGGACTPIPGRPLILFSHDIDHRATPSNAMGNVPDGTRH
jgi:hypothetical protein